MNWSNKRATRAKGTTMKIESAHGRGNSSRCIKKTKAYHKRCNAQIVFQDATCFQDRVQQIRGELGVVVDACQGLPDLMVGFVVWINILCSFTIVATPTIAASLNTGGRRRNRQRRRNCRRKSGKGFLFVVGRQQFHQRMVFVFQSVFDRRVAKTIWW